MAGVAARGKDYRLLDDAVPASASGEQSSPVGALPVFADKGQDWGRRASKGSVSTSASAFTNKLSFLSRTSAGDNNPPGNSTAMEADPLTGELKPLSAELLEHKSHWPLGVAAVVLVLYFLLGCLLLRARYGWSTVDSCYFLVITLTTIGYGDLAFPATAEDRIVGGIFVFVGVAWMGWAVGVILSHFSSNAALAVQAITKANMVRQLSRLNPEMSEASRTHEFEDKLSQLCRKLRRCVVQVAVTVVVGVVVAMHLEGWSGAEAFYWVCITSTTVGYGDVVPTKASMKWFTCVYSIFAFGFLAETIAYIGNIPMEVQKARHFKNILHQFGRSIEMEELNAVVHSDVLHHIRSNDQREWASENPSVTRSEFILWMLVMQGKITLEDVEPTGAIFDQLDVDGSGHLDSQDTFQLHSRSGQRLRTASSGEAGDSL